MFRKLCVLAVPVVAVLSLNVNAGQVSQAKVEAQEVVEDYKKLRAICSVSIGEERKDCFAKLNSTNGSYKAAKKILSDNHGAGTDNIHIVSFVD